MAGKEQESCVKCDMCGSEVKSNLSCTMILNNEESVEEACWCVCSDCASKFKTDVKGFYDEMIKEKNNNK